MSQTKSSTISKMTLSSAIGAKRALPKSWTHAAGILSVLQRKKLEKHVRTTRKEWSRR